jgi:hypothetical protein
MSIIAKTLAALRLGDPARVGSLSVFPLLGPDDPLPEYLTLDEALERDAIRVTEVSAGGIVPELKVANRGALPVLLLDGELLVGAKQNRILNLSILVPAGSELTIPVSCVEAGRWSWRGERFHAAASAAPAMLRSVKAGQVSDSLAGRGERRSQQGRVWGCVEDVMRDLNIMSPTSDLQGAFEASEERLRGLERELPCHAGQRGALFGVGARVAGLDLFDRSSTFAKYQPKLARSYGLETLTRRSGGEAPLPQSAAARFLDALGSAAASEYPAIGLGADLRLAAPGLVGAALVCDARVAHLCAFERPGGRQDGAEVGSPIAPASLRRRRFG